VPDPEQITADRIAREAPTPAPTSSIDDFIDAILGGGSSTSTTTTTPKTTSTPRASSSSSGGGGSVAATYSDTYTDHDGSLTGVPGTIYQYGPTGQIQIIYRPPAAPAPVRNPADQNDDGLDDTTNLALGVFPSSKSPTGYVYSDGRPVYPNGALYTGPGLTEEPEPPKTLTSGGVVYIWDGAQGKFVPAPGIQSAPTSSGGGNTFTGSGMKLSVPSGSGGGGSSGSTRDYIGEIEARTDSELTIARERAALEKELFFAKLAAENDPNNIANQIRVQQLNLQMQQFAASEARAGAQERRATINDFRDAFNDTDPSAQHAMLYAQGVGAGGNIVNRLAAGDNALSDQALSGAAALLQQLRVPPSSPMAQWVPQMGGLGGAPAPGGTGTPGLPGAPTGGVPGAPTVPGLPAAPTGPTDQQVAREAAMRQDQAADAERAKFLTENAEGNWTQIPGPGAIPYYKNTVTGHAMPVSEWYALMEDVRSAQGTPTRGDEFLNGLNANEAVWYGAVPDAEGQGGLWVDYGGTFRSGSNPIALKDYGRQLYGDAPVTTTGMYGAPTYTAPDFRSLTTPTVAPTYSLADDQVQQGVDLPNKTTVPMLAMGGLARTAAITGDPQPGSNRPNPELTEWTPQGLRVTPLNRMPPQRARALMRGLPRHFGGFDPYTTGFNPYGGTGGLVDTISKYSTPTYTQPAPVQQPTYTRPATGSAPATFGPTQPAPVQPATPSAPTSGVSIPAPYDPNGGMQAPPSVPGPMNDSQQPVMTGLNTPSGVINTTGLTPEEQALLDEVRQVRESTPVPDLGGMSPYDVAFNTLTPGSRDAFFKGMAAKKGIRPEDFQWEVARNQQMMPGLSRGGMSTGY
jgi:hypothetical protein